MEITNRSWNGTAWSEVADLAQALMFGAGSGGSSISALSSGGETTASPDTQAVTEEWTAADFEVKTLTTS